MINKDFQSLKIDSRMSEVRRAAAWFRDITAGVDEKTCNECELALVEALTNVVEHGYSGEAGTDIILYIKSDEGELEFVIEDFGKPIPESALERSKSALDFDPNDLSNLPTGGIGLALIKETMSSFEYSAENSKNQLRMIRSF